MKLNLGISLALILSSLLPSPAMAQSEEALRAIYGEALAFLDEGDCQSAQSKFDEFLRLVLVTPEIKAQIERHVNTCILSQTGSFFEKGSSRAYLPKQEPGEFKIGPQVIK